MRLLDLYCCAGGAARGYQRAGFHVTGVDIRGQPRYAGDVFVQDDALEYLAEHGSEFDAIHASPPCQAFTQISVRHRGKGGIADSHVDWLTPTRRALVEFTQPWVIENVQGAKRHMSASLILHGGQFGLGVHRPRFFESNVLIPSPHGSRTPRVEGAVGVYGQRPDGRKLNYQSPSSTIRAASSIDEASAAMGIDWMTWEEIREAIPPAYTEWIGRHLLVAVAACA